MARYAIEGIEYPSPTEVLGTLDKSNGLMPWAAKLERKKIQEDPDYNGPWAYKEKQEEALDIGSAVHDVIEYYIREGKDKTIDQIYSKDLTGDQKKQMENSFLAFLKWSDDNKVEWHHSEMTVVSKEHCFAGTLDAIATINGKKYVIDFKSSKGFYDGYGKQVAAYRMAVLEDKGIETYGCGVLRLDKETGEPEWKDYTKKQDRKGQAFIKLLDFWYTDKKRRLKNNRRAV